MRVWFVFVMLLSGVVCFSQADTTEAPYKRFPTLPPFKMLLKDSTVYAKKDLPEKKAVWFIVFGPDCSHCQEETQQLIAHKNDLKDIQVVMVTMHPMPRMKQFISQYNLDQLTNVVVGQDHTYFMAPFFGFKNIPFQAMYDKKGKLLAGFEGTMEMEKVLEIFKSKK